MIDGAVVVVVNEDYIFSCMRLKVLERFRDFSPVPRSFQMVPIPSMLPGIDFFL